MSQENHDFEIAEEIQQAAQAAQAAQTQESRKRRKPSNYVLERLESVPVGADRAPMWEQVEDGFLSPEAAIEYVSEAALTGRFRAIRVASDEYVSELTRPEPVLTVTKVKKTKKV